MGSGGYPSKPVKQAESILVKLLLGRPRPLHGTNPRGASHMAGRAKWCPLELCSAQPEPPHTTAPEEVLIKSIDSGIGRPPPSQGSGNNGPPHGVAVTSKG